MSRIRAIGVEMEGGWSRNMTEPVHSDGSVCFDSNRDRNGNRIQYQGEVHTPATAPELFDTLAEWMRRQYPDIVNESCGMHVHVSFEEDSSYSLCMEREFHNLVGDVFTHWGRAMGIPDRHHFWKRVNGECSYCDSKIFDPDNQSQRPDKGGSRYARLNFCYKLHGTMELRMLPMFEDPEVSIKAIKRFVDLVEEWLENHPEDRGVGGRVVGVTEDLIVCETAYCGVTEEEEIPLCV